ncbi:unnamed protein product, partial [Lampetra fluviatilis]
PACQLRDVGEGGSALRQCWGCCPSRSFPTPRAALDAMAAPKNLTSESRCCVAVTNARHGVNVSDQVACRCDACRFHKN